jgi:hypothetical protein
MPPYQALLTSIKENTEGNGMEFYLLTVKEISISKLLLSKI